MTDVYISTSKKSSYGCWRFSVLILLVILWAMVMPNNSFAQTTGNIQGIAPVQAPTNGTAIDGNAYANHVFGLTDNTSGVPQNYGTAGDIFYWDQVYPGTGGGVFDILPIPDPPYFNVSENSYPGVADYTVVRYIDDITNKDPTIFLGRNKINDNPNTYEWGVGSNPNKNEIQNAGVIFTRGNSSIIGIDGNPGNPDDLWVAWAADREVTNGSSYIDFEFLQKPFYMDTLGMDNAGYYYGKFVTEADAATGGRTPGDILVTVEFTNGGPVANVIVLIWQNVGGTYQYVPFTDYPHGTILATVNTEKTYVHFPAFGNVEQVTLVGTNGGTGFTGMLPYYDINQWCEGAINLSAFFDEVTNPCFGIATVFTRTRTSGESATAELKDFPGPPAQVNVLNDPPVVNCPGDLEFEPCAEVNLEEQWDSWRVQFSYVEGTGNSTEPVSVTMGGDDLPEDLPQGASCGFTATHWIKAVDYCGKMDSCGATFTVLPDAVAPVFAEVPADITYECATDLPAAGMLGWTDNCDGSGEVLGVDESDGQSCPETITRTWSYTDACGNSTSVSQIITIHDMTAPVIADMDDMMLEGCNPDWPAEVTTTWTDNCGVGGQTSGSLAGVAGEVMWLDDCTQYIDYTFNATDDCGNAAEEVVIRVSRHYDMTAPVIADMDDMMLEGCNPDWPAEVTTTWTDNCGVGGQTSGSLAGVAGEVMWLDDCTQYIDYTFNATDDCGNAAEEVVIRVSRHYDMTAPVIADMDDMMLEGCNPDWPAEVTTTWTDNCGVGGQTSGSLAGVAGEVMWLDDCTQYIDYTFNATDDCGNAAEEVVIRVSRHYDMTAPVIADMDDMMLEGCNPDWPAEVTTTWTDNCGVGGQTSGSLAGVAGEVMWLDDCTQYIDYTFNATDDCGNAAEEVVIRVSRHYDMTAPVIADMDDMMLEGCNPDWPAEVTTTWTDNCGVGGQTSGSLAGVAGEVMWLDDCTQYIDYTFNATDDCGNAAEEVVIRVSRHYDMTAPVIADMDDMMLEGCNPDWPAEVTTTWTDNCGVGGQTSGSLAGVAGEVMWLDDCTQYIDYTFNATDDCGNAAEEVVIRVSRHYDMTAPVIADMDDMMLEGCNPDWPAEVTTTWTDNCGVGGQTSGSLAGVAGEVMWLDDCTQYIDYTFNATDDCGNAAEEVVIRVSRHYDMTAPVIADMDDMMLEGCNPDWPAEVTTTWTDNCGVGGQTSGSLAGVAGEVMWLDDCTQYIDYTFNATDDCGNAAEEVVIRVSRHYDMTAPVIADMDDMMLEGCNPDWPAEVTTTWTDNCGVGGQTSGSLAGVAGEVMWLDDCTQYIDYTFNATDDCGNAAEEVVIRVSRHYDMTAPVIADMDDMMLEGCNPDWPAEVTTTWTDNCGVGGQTSGSLAGVAGEVMWLDDCTQYIDYTFNATDDCGNAAEEVVIRVSRHYDMTAPVIADMDDMMLEGCNPDWPAEVTTTWTDNCGVGGQTSGSLAGVAGEVMWLDDCTQYIDYTFNATDDCGNAAEEVVIRVSRHYDMTAPVIADMDDMMLEGCNPDWPAEVTTTWTDNCGVGGQTSGSLAGVAGEVMWLDDCTQYIDYTFNATDDCGNAAEEVVIRVSRHYDMTAPVIADMDDMMLEGCNPDWPAEVTTTWTDNCGVGGQTSGSLAGVAGEVMWLDDCTQYIDYTFNATDDCGNAAEEVVIRVSRHYDMTAPVIADMDDMMLEGCNPDWPAEVTTTWTDNCGVGGQTSGSLAGVAGEVMWLDDCTQYIDYTFNATDDCGNAAEEVVIRVSRHYDMTAPVIADMDDMMLEGCNPDWPAEVTTTWTDNCGVGGQTSGSLAGVAGEVMWLDDCTQYIDYTFNATDDCGNAAEEVVIRVSRHYDMTAPVIADMDDMMLEGCNPDWPAEVTTTWTDNCGVGGQTSGSLAGVAGEVMWLDDCTQYIDYTFNATDDCGNAAEEVVIRVSRHYDMTAPVIADMDDMMLEGCNPDWPAEVTTTWTDNCGVGGQTSGSLAGVAGEVMWLDDCTQYIDYTFNATDDCGNAAEEVVIRVSRHYDMTAPVIADMDDMMLEGCNPDWPAEVTTTWTDNCGVGGQTSGSLAGVAGEVMWLDDCTQYIDYTFNATDDCGNAAEEVVIRVSRHYDMTAPVIADMDDMMLEGCNPDWPAEVTTTWTDNCGVGGQTSGSLAGVAGEVMWLDDCTQYIDYTFNATDDCGNAAEEVVIRVSRHYDMTAPVIADMDDMMLEGCNPDWPAEVTTTWTDNCGVGGQTSGSLAGVAGEVMWLDDCTQYIDYTFNATDDCGNAAEEVVIRVSRHYDMTAPVIADMDDMMLEGCNPDWPAEVTTTWTDNCGVGGQTSGSLAGVAGEVMWLDDCTQYIDYTFNATDDCGNAAEEVVIRVSRHYDMTAPVIADMDDMMLEGCNPDWPAEVTTTWTDNCGVGGQTSGSLAGVAGEVMWLDDCTQYIDYTFNATDDCGNAAEEVVIRVSRHYDMTAPVIADMDDMMLEGCNPDWPAEVTTTWTDNCGVGGQTSGSLAGVAGEVMWLDDCTQYIDYTFNATDDCGNAAEEVVIRVSRHYDMTAPVIADMDDMMLEGCNPDWPAEVTTTWTDNCGVGGQTSGSLAGVAGEVMWLDDCTQYIDYTFNATDDCGNAAEEVVIRVSRHYDMTAPEIIGGEDYAVCNEELPYELTLAWTDNCSEGGEVTAIGEFYSATECDTVYAYTFSITDECDNSAEKTIYVTKESSKYSNCETAIAKLDGDYESDARCFLEDGFSRWGWTNMIVDEGEYSLPLYAGAAQCMVDKGTLVGQVIVTYSGGTVTVEYQISEGYALSEAHVYVGCEPYPIKNGVPTVAPGQFTFNAGNLDHVNGLTAEFDNVQGGFYIIAHAVTCEAVCSCSQSEGPVYADDYEPMDLGIDCNMDVIQTENPEGPNEVQLIAYPNPFSHKATFEFTANKDGMAKIELYNMFGQKVATILKQKVSKGQAVVVDYVPDGIASGVYIYRFMLAGASIDGKLNYTEKK